IAMTIISGTTIIVESFLPKTNALPQQPLSDATHFRCLLWAFLLIGLSVEILLVLPYKIGLLSWTLPGSVQYLSTFSKLAIIMLFALVYKCGATHYRLLLYPLIFIELTLGLMTFTKQAVVEVCLATGLGWSLGRPKLRMLIVGGVAVICLYGFVLTPFMYF